MHYVWKLDISPAACLKWGTVPWPSFFGLRPKIQNLNVLVTFALTFDFFGINEKYFLFFIFFICHIYPSFMRKRCIAMFLDGKSALAWELLFPGHLSSTLRWGVPFSALPKDTTSELVGVIQKFMA